MYQSKFSIQSIHITPRRMIGVWFTLMSILAAASQGSPLPAHHNKLKYDQRQEGKYNIRADLENFIILVIPTPASSSNGSLLDYIFKTLPTYKKATKNNQQHQNAPLPDAQQFLESKTAPYHVDISRTKSHLAKLHPEVEGAADKIKEDAIVAHSPKVEIAKSPESEGDDKDDILKKAKAIIIQLPTDNENVQRRGTKDVIGGKNDEDVKKTIGLSVHENERASTLAAKAQKVPVTEKPDLDYQERLQKIADEVRTSHAVILAKTIHVGLVEYFKRLAEAVREQHRAEREAEELEEKAPERLKTQTGKAVLKVKETKKEEKGTPKIDLEPPKLQKDEIKEDAKEQLLLLGAELEQCGPERERDSMGVCVPMVKS